MGKKRDKQIIKSMVETLNNLYCDIAGFNINHKDLPDDIARELRERETKRLHPMERHRSLS